MGLHCCQQGPPHPGPTGCPGCAHPRSSLPHRTAQQPSDSAGMVSVAILAGAIWPERAIASSEGLAWEFLLTYSHIRADAACLKGHVCHFLPCHNNARANIFMSKRAVLKLPCETDQCRVKTCLPTVSLSDRTRLGKTCYVRRACLKFAPEWSCQKVSSRTRLTHSNTRAKMVMSNALV